MDIVKNVFLAIFNFIKTVVVYSLTHPFPQILIVIVFLSIFRPQLFKHSKFGVFVKCTDNVVHDNRVNDNKK